MKHIFKVTLPGFWLAFITFLFCLPGAALPKADWLSKIWFDKWVHIGFFLVLLWLWHWAIGTIRRKEYVVLVLMAVGYGLAIEIIQHNFIANRSFDLGDLIADSIGCIVGTLGWDRSKKNRPL